MNSTRKITYSAVGAAVSSVCVLLTNFGWLKVSLLLCAALCYYIVAVKCGLLYGIADIVISLLITFFTGGITIFSSAFLLDVIVFAPFSVLSYFLRGLHYTKLKTALVRVAIVAAFANLALCGVWFAASRITTLNISDISSRLGGYAVLALVFTLSALLFDFLFNQLSIRVIKLIK